MASRPTGESVLYAIIGRALSDMDYRERLMGKDEGARRGAFEEVLGTAPSKVQMEKLDAAVQYVREFEAQFNGIRPCS